MYDYERKRCNNAGSAYENGNQETVDINSDADVPGTGHLNDPIEDESEIEKLQKEVTDWKDKYLRQVAEFDNFRKEMRRKDEIDSNSRKGNHY